MVALAVECNCCREVCVTLVFHLLGLSLYISQFLSHVLEGAAQSEYIKMERVQKYRKYLLLSSFSLTLVYF